MASHSDDDVDMANPSRELPSLDVVLAYSYPERHGRGAHRDDDDPPEDPRIAEAEYARDFPQVMSESECAARNWHYPEHWRFDDE